MFQITPRHDFLVGIDSDGCTFDTMELKHKECFIPNIIKFYKLQGISKYAREAAEFVNLYSKRRGVNRFPALVETLEWLQKRPEVRLRGYNIRVPESLRAWIKEESKLGNPALSAKVEATKDADLELALRWSKQVNADVEAMVHGVAPFPCVRESLQKLQLHADMLCVSATPNQALEAEWKEHGIDQFVSAICGQEAGSKKETLGNAKHYPPDHTLMIGDAPGDYDAAKANQCLFYPINPGDEEQSWKRFLQEGIDKFLQGTFAGSYQQMLLHEFESRLPSLPPWPIVS